MRTLVSLMIVIALLFTVSRQVLAGESAPPSAAVSKDSSWPTGTWTGSWAGLKEGDSGVIPFEFTLERIDGSVAKGRIVYPQDVPQYGVHKSILPYSRGRLEGTTITIGTGKPHTDGKVYKWVFINDPEGMRGELWIDDVQKGRSALTPKK